MPVIQTGSATNNIDLLQKLVTWLVSRSWTSNMSQVDGVGVAGASLQSGHLYQPEGHGAQ